LNEAVSLFHFHPFIVADSTLLPLVYLFWVEIVF